MSYVYYDAVGSYESDRPLTPEEYNLNAARREARATRASPWPDAFSFLAFFGFFFVIAALGVWANQ